MSHFGLLVVCDKDLKSLSEVEEYIEDVLEPFNENSGISIILSDKERIEHVRKEMEIYKKDTWNEYIKDPEKFLKEHGDSTYMMNSIKRFKDALTWDDQRCLKEYMDYYGVEKDVQGNTTYEPNHLGEWDYFVVGGRYMNYLKYREDIDRNVADGSDYGNIGRKKDIDFEGMVKDLMEERKKTWNQFEDTVKRARLSEEYSEEKYQRAVMRARFKLHIGKDDTRDSYINDVRFCLYAILKDGNWYSNDNFCMFGPLLEPLKNSEEAWEKRFSDLLSQAHPDSILAVVDCHV